MKNQTNRKSAVVAVTHKQVVDASEAAASSKKTMKRETTTTKVEHRAKRSDRYVVSCAELGSLLFVDNNNSREKREKSLKSFSFSLENCLLKAYNLLNREREA